MTPPARSALHARLDAAGLDWIVPAWAAPAHVIALSTTKAGGIAGAFDPGPSRAGEAASPSHVAADRARLASFLPAPPVYLHQVHGRAVAAQAEPQATLRWPTSPRSRAYRRSPFRAP